MIGFVVGSGRDVVRGGHRRGPDRIALRGAGLPAGRLRRPVAPVGAVIEDLPGLEAGLGGYRALAGGDTGSERFFALISKHIDGHGGDVTAGIIAAVRWVAAELPVYSINLILTTARELWALRYPGTHELLVLERAAGGPHGDRHLDHASPADRVRARCGALSEKAAVVVASERMDEDTGWRALRPGELLHVDGQRTVTRETITAGADDAARPVGG